MSEIHERYRAETGAKATYKRGAFVFPTFSYVDWLENRITAEEKLQAKIDYLDERLIELSDENTSLLPKNLALQAEVERLKRLVKKAYHEGRFDKGCGCGEWKESDALEALAEQEASDEPTT